jgi:molybdopterin-synthase adenylyltransferase
MSVDYAELTGRNAGFLSEREQEMLRRSRVLVCGVGGMGGAAAASMVRAGLGAVTLTDPDRFEVSNLNRQTFAFVDTLGEPKAEEARSALLRINPGLSARVVGSDWVERLDELLPTHPVVVNGMDDVRAGIRLYRKAREHGATVIDAYTSPYPSVTVVGPGDPCPEERLGFPTVGTAAEELSAHQLEEARRIEIEYVARVSSGIGRLDSRIVHEIIAHQRPRSSFCPVVTIAGNMMAFEAIGRLLGRRSGAGCDGYFVDLWSGRIERGGTS